MAIAGLRGTGDWGQDQRPKSFREMILWLNPNGTAPITALMSRVRKKTITDPEHSWWSEPNDLVRLQVNGALTASDTLVTVDSTDPTASAIDSRYGSALNLVPGDILMVEPSADSATYDPEIVKVTAVYSATQFSVERGYAGSTAGTIADNAYLLKIGSAFAEGTAAPSSTSRNPVKFYNLAQIWKTTYAITETVRVTETRTGPEEKQEQRRASFDHARGIELSILFGRRQETIGDNGKPERTMGGLREFIPATILQNNWSIANPATPGNSLLDAISPVFDWDTEAGDERIAFVGNGTLNQINSAIMKASGVGASTIQWGPKAEAWGMRFTTLYLPQGTIFLKVHPLMSRHPIYTYGMFILDMSALTWCPLKGRDTHLRKDIQNKDEDLVRGEWLTEGTIEIVHGGKTCRYIGGFNAAIA